MSRHEINRENNKNKSGILLLFWTTCPHHIRLELFIGGCTLFALLVQHVGAFSPATHPSPPRLNRHSNPVVRSRGNNGGVDGNGSSIATTRLRARPQTRFREVQGNILSLRTNNEFEPSLPSDWERSMERSIKAAMHAPNHKRSKPWRFYLLGLRSIERLCRLNADLVASKKEEAAEEKKLKRWLKMPVWLVVTCATNKGTGNNAAMGNPMGLAREDHVACCCAVQNLCLTLNSQGLVHGGHNMVWHAGANTVASGEKYGIGGCLGGSGRH